MIEILRTGSHMCIVDRGRFGLRKYGVPTSGSMDQASAAVANSIVGNDMSAAVLELYMPGHQLKFHCDTYIALSGARTQLQLDNRNIYTDSIIKITKGQVLSVGSMTKGCRLYLATYQGIQTAEFLKSKSPLTGSYDRSLHKGDQIKILNHPQFPVQKNSNIVPIKIELQKEITAYPGPEWHKLSKGDQKKILSTTYMIDYKSDRMGYRLNGTAIKGDIEEIFSSPVMPGTIQLLPSGLPLILMRDCQTTGGYPRILQVTESDINQLSQRRPGDEVNFQLRLIDN